MCGPKSKRFFGLLVAFSFLFWPISSAVADHILTEAQYQKLISNLTSLEQINKQQQDLLQKQGTTLQAQQQTISSLQASLTEQISLLPQVSKSFDQAIKQERSNGQIWRFVGVVTLGTAVGYQVDKGTGALVGGLGCAVIDGFLWLIGK